ncbi:MAG: hypothetical protein A2X11_01705 [Bacteroidetes bacterium GWE2_42_24]|nr:MAG: hypothetical protein A2X11_01705 [Bacteroidetes bacterium GWE2_42_24]OFY29751.1 MAG: hypothetical protein A2X09_01470 [Bacteroidetes bacterium GWF2_43_11]
MHKHTSNLINAIVLVVLGLWGYLASETPSMTALIPVAAGLILAALHKGVSSENKLQAHIAVVLTLLVFIGLIKPLLGGIDRGQAGSIVRVAVMMLTSMVSMICFVKSFIDARRSRR